MLYRTVKTDIWSDPWFETLHSGAKCLFLYLFTNDRVSACGAMEISLARIATDTKIPAKKIAAELAAFGDKICWLPEHNLIVVRNFYKHQRSQSSENFTKAAKKAMADLPREARAWLGGVYPELLDTPTHPIPNPSPSLGDKETATATATAGGGRGSRLPDPFPMNDEMRRWAATDTPGLDIEFHHKQFCRYWWGKSGRDAVKANWELTWQKWMAKEHNDMPPTTAAKNGMPPEIARLPYNNADRLKWENDHRRASA